MHNVCFVYRVYEMGQSGIDDRWIDSRMIGTVLHLLACLLSAVVARAYVRVDEQSLIDA